MVDFGLVIEGGGTKTAYSGGVLKCLLDNGIYAPYGVGISAGAEFLQAYASQQADRLKKIGIDCIANKECVGIRPMLKEKSVFGLNATNDCIEKLAPLDKEKLMNSPTLMEDGVYNLETHEIEYFDQSYIDEDNSLTKASCSLLLLCPPYTFNGKKYMDAGLRVMIPIERSIEKGYKKHLVISCKELGYVRKPAPSYQLWLANRVYKDPVVTEDLKNRHIRFKEQWDLIHDLEQKGQALVLRPSKDMGVSRYTTDRSKLEPWFNLGYQETLDRMDEIKKFLEIE
ncbi:patatin-like phospholipase family protein [Floccifex sp.]|uniref:patatin-like phospholipase family protein n=1 Tax=Floccifex sp. TaxID=2815810 RepID=UPI002A75D559|nr:patatin family protein [Floccifex sp.]MDD7281678.1 patatin family protein [Erysipelotrichaceae bacterium]MDY2958974.1 patatin family protein [Floccifex sp.]